MNNNNNKRYHCPTGGNGHNISVKTQYDNLAVLPPSHT